MQGIPDWLVAAHKKRNGPVRFPFHAACGNPQIEMIPEDSIEMIKAVALSYKPDGTLNYRCGPALVFVLNTGLRESELLALSKNVIQKVVKAFIFLKLSAT